MDHVVRFSLAQFQSFASISRRSPERRLTWRFLLLALAVRVMQNEQQQPPDDKTYDSIRFGDFKSYMERKKRKLKDQEQLMWACEQDVKIGTCANALFKA